MKNLGKKDRTIRILLGIVLLAFGYGWLSGWLAYASYILGAIILIEGIAGFCLLYKLFNISTLKTAVVKPPQAPPQFPPQQPPQ